MKAFLVLLLSCSCAFAQFGGVDLPFFGSVPTAAVNPCSLVLSNLPGVLSYVDINNTIIGTNGVNHPANNTVVGSWMDGSANGYNWSNVLSVPTPVYFTTGGPTNGACITFTNPSASYVIQGALTNALGGITYTQPITVFMVINDPSCCNGDNFGVLFDSGSTNQLMQMVTFHPNIGITAMNLVSPNSVFLWDGTVGNDSSTFGWPYNTWGIVTVQFNGTNSHVFINGVGPRFTNIYGPNYAPGSNNLSGFTMANSQTPTGDAGRSHSMQNPSIVSFAAFIICQGASYTSGSLRLQVEEALGCEFGISVP